MMLFLLLVVLLPQHVLIATSRGQASIPVTNEAGSAAVEISRHYLFRMGVIAWKKAANVFDNQAA